VISSIGESIMIVATRIPSLTKRMLAATLAAQARQNGVAVAGSELRLVRQLEALGYNVRIERRAA
jgi:hypothetical protein